MVQMDKPLPVQSTLPILSAFDSPDFLVTTTV
jgi:hypothetical protein